MISLKKDELRHFVLFQANLAKLMIISVSNAAMRRFKTGNFFFFFISSFYILYSHAQCISQQYISLVFPVKLLSYPVQHLIGGGRSAT